MTYANYKDLKRDKPFRWWYDEIINWRLAHPGTPENEAAKHFGVSRGYYSVIVNSDMFKARWEQRRRLYNDEVGESIQKKLLGALDLGLDVVTEQLKKKRGDIPFDKTTKFVNDTLERLGYGEGKPNLAVNVSVGGNVAVSVTARELAEARELLRRSQSARIVDTSSALPPPQHEAFLDALTPIEGPPKDEADAA